MIDTIKDYAELAASVLWGCDDCGDKSVPVLCAATSLTGIALEKTDNICLRTIGRTLQATTLAMMSLAFTFFAIFNSGLAQDASLAILFVVPSLVKGTQWNTYYSTALKVVNLSGSAFAISSALVYGLTVSPVGLAAHGVNFVGNAAALWKKFA